MDRDSERLLVMGGLALGAYLLIRKTLSNLNPFADPGGDTIDKELQKPSTGSSASPWSPNFWKTGKPVMGLKTTMSQQLIEQLLNSVGYVYDSFPQAMAVFKQLRTQSQVSVLAEEFYKSQGQDLLSWLRGGNYPADHFSNEEVNLIMKYVDNLPKYNL